MTCADDFHLRVHVLGIDFPVSLLQGLRQCGQRSGRCFLHEEVAVMGMSEGIHHEIHRVVQRHHETRHAWICNGDGLARRHLFYPQRNDRATAGHHVAIAGAAYGRLCTLAQLPTFGNSHLFHQGLAHAHRVNRIGSLVGGEHHDALHAMLNGRVQYVFSTHYIGAHCLYGKKLARGYLLQSRRAKHVVHVFHGHVHGRLIAHVADVELHFRVLERVAHIVLLLLVATENTDLTDVAVKEATKDGIAKRAGAAGDQ